MLTEIKNIIASNKLDDVILSGITSIEEGVAEFLPITKYIYLEFGESLLEIESSEQYSKIQIRVVNSVIHEPEFEDVLPSYCSIANIVILNPLDRYKVKSISLINLKEEDFYVECDVLELVLENGQIMFIDPRFFGNTIGGAEQKALWVANRKDDKEYSVSEFIISETSPSA